MNKVILITLSIITILSLDCRSESIVDLRESCILRGSYKGMYLPNERPILIEETQLIKNLESTLFDKKNWQKISDLEQEPKLSTSTYFYFIRDRKIIAFLIDEDTLIVNKTLYKSSNKLVVETMLKILKNSKKLVWVSSDEGYDFSSLK